jgi:hypothetical protein
VSLLDVFQDGSYRSVIREHECLADAELIEQAEDPGIGFGGRQAPGVQLMR